MACSLAGPGGYLRYIPDKKHESGRRIFSVLRYHKGFAGML